MLSSLSGRGPRIRELNERQADVVLRRNHVGRVAFTRDGRVEICPVHYVYAEGSLYGRTSPGAKSGAWRLASEVVFEVDETAGVFDWRSVIVRGTLSILRPRGACAEPFAYWKAVAAIRTLVPDAFTERDPLPYRFIVFRIAPTEVTARQATSVTSWSPLVTPCA